MARLLWSTPRLISSALVVWHAADAPGKSSQGHLLEANPNDESTSLSQCAAASSSMTRQGLAVPDAKRGRPRQLRAGPGLRFHRLGR